MKQKGQVGQVKLSQVDVKYLEGLLAKGKTSAKTFKRATALLELHRGKTLEDVAKTLVISNRTVARLRDSYASQGVACLKDASRSGRPIKIDGTHRFSVSSANGTGAGTVCTAV